MGYLYVTVIVFAVNLLPAFGPPTWAILVFAKLNWHLNSVLLIVLGCTAAAIGRYLLARGAQRFHHYLPARYVRNLNDAKELVTQRRSRILTLAGVVVISPHPSAQLCVAAGVLALPHRRVAGAFVVGRLVTYSLYISAASLASAQLTGVLGDTFKSPWSIALQLLLLLLVCALPLVNWRHAVHRPRRSNRPDPSPH